MIKARTTAPDGSILLIYGLERGNWDRLLQGKPILLRLADLGLGSDPEMKIAIFGGEDGPAIMDQLRTAGFELPEQLLSGAVEGAA